MTEEEKKEFEEFLEWKAEKKRKEEKISVKQEEAEKQVKVNAQIPQVEEEKNMEFDNKRVPYSSNNEKNESNNTDEKSLQPSHYRLYYSFFCYFSSCLLLYYQI